MPSIGGVTLRRVKWGVKPAEKEIVPPKGIASRRPLLICSARIGGSSGSVGGSHRSPVCRRIFSARSRSRAVAAARNLSYFPSDDRATSRSRSGLTTRPQEQPLSSGSRRNLFTRLSYSDDGVHVAKTGDEILFRSRTL